MIVNRLSFRNKLLLSMASLVLVSLMLLSLLAGTLLRSEVYQAAESEMQASLKITQNTAEQWLGGKARIIQALAARLPASPADWAVWEEPLTLGLLAGGFDRLYVGTGSGKMIQSQPPDTLPENFDPRVRAWYLQARQAGGLIVTPPYEDSGTTNLVITLAHPLRAESESVLGADLMISGAVQKMVATQTRWTSQIWMLDREQRILVHPDRSQLQKKLTDLLPGLALENTAVQQVTHENRDWLVRSIDVPQAGWTFLMLVDEAEVKQGVVEMMRQLAFLSLLVILGSVLVLYPLTLSLSRPLVDFQRQLKNITHTLDLSQRLQTDDQSELGDLANQTNSLLERLSVAINEVFRSSGRLTASAGRLAQTAGLVSRNSHLQQEVSQSMAAAVEEMSSSVAEITSTMEELSASSTQIADHSQSVVDVANLTLDSSKKGASAMQQLQQRMGEIHRDNEQSLHEIMELGAKSKQISKVMDLINTLADQTKLIAFNAALEASSAGESGKRFSVVAGEIRRLADSVTDSTREIEDRIQEIQDSISRLVITSEKGSNSIQAGMEVSSVTAEDLNALVRAASQTSSAAQQISMSTRQQKTASSQVVIALRDIANASAHNAQSVRNITEISEEMLSMSENLNHLVREFKMADQQKG